MANDFLDKYNKKAEQDTANAPSEPKAEKMNYSQNSGFTPPVKRSAPAVQTKKFPIWYVIVPVVIIIIAVILIFALTGGKALPKMEGWTKSEAELWANENGVIIRTENVFSDEVESSKIISQKPAEGEKIKKGEFLELTISSGPDYDVLIELPDIMSMTMKEVEAWANDNHMTKVRVTTEASDTVEMGKAIRYTINDNTVTSQEVKRDTALYVIFSSGIPEGEPIEVPDFTTMTAEEAETFGSENKITVTFNEEFSDDHMKGQIFAQSVKAEEKVTEGSTITLTISKGKEVLVPKFSSYSKEEAAMEASKLGITVLQEEKYSKYKKETLISQSISPGTLYEEGDYITLVYSLGNQFELSSFVGQDETDLRSWILQFNEQGASLSIKPTYTTSDKPAGTILSQTKSNVKISVSEAIHVVVSSGPILYAPNFVLDKGQSYADIMTREKALAICEELQIVPVFVAEKQDGRLEGEIWSQSVASGKAMGQGDTITLKYVPVNSTYSVPDFYGKTHQEILAMAADKQFTIVYIEAEYVEGMERKIVTQSIFKNTKVAPGTIIELGICPDKVVEPFPDEPLEDDTTSQSEPVVDASQTIE